MSDFTIRSESVDVEQIMKQIRARILEKRGADYTEDQIRELATVRLEKFLDSKNLRSDLLEQFRKSRPAVHTDPPKIEPPYTFDDQTLFTSHRGPLRLIRKLLMPVLKLFFNPNVLNQILHTQAQFNVDLLKRESRRKIEFDRSRAEWNALYYEVLHNLVLETTRMGIEVQNLRMRVESLSSRLDFSERRVRALEGVVQYRPEVVRAERREGGDGEQAAPPAAPHAPLEGFVPGGQPGQEGGGRRRRRRRRGRRGQGAPQQGAPGPQGAQGAPGANVPGTQGTQAPEAEDTEGFDEGPDDEGPEELEAGGFDVPEPGDDSSEIEGTATMDDTRVPEPPDDPKDDDLQ
ncbi:MAG TPA: hypothetical protein VJ691_00615 [Vicinamibacterales bacterium]|nr:hypothetical protein [Vicinamibacterales bacterium]